MANKRMILMKHLDSPVWRKISVRQRYLYWAITLLTDDDGVLSKDHVSRVFYPEDDVMQGDIEDDLDALIAVDLIHVYRDEFDFIQILNWWDFQYLDARYYKPTQYPKSEFYLKRPKQLQKGANRSCYDVDAKPLSRYASSTRVSPVQHNSNKPNSTKHKEKKECVETSGTSRMRSRLSKWLKSCGVGEPIVLTEEYLQLYGDDIIELALDEHPGSKDQFLQLCNRLKTSSNEK